MWYDSFMAFEDLDTHLANAGAAADYAKDVRTAHRRRTSRSSPQRQADIQVALDRLRDAMKPLRRTLAQVTYKRRNLSHTQIEMLAAVSDASMELQRERRKLWKMKQRKENNGS